MLAAPDELDRLVEVEARLEERLTAARAEAQRRIAAAEAAALAAEEALDRELAPALEDCREQAGRRLAEQLAGLRHGAAERATALDALGGTRFDALVAQVLDRLGSAAS